MIRRLQRPWEWRAEPCNATCTHRQGSRLVRPGGWEGPLFGRIPYDRRNLRGGVALSTGIAPKFEPLPRHRPRPDRFPIAIRLFIDHLPPFTCNAHTALENGANHGKDAASQFLAWSEVAS